VTEWARSTFTKRELEDEQEWAVFPAAAEAIGWRVLAGSEEKPRPLLMVPKTYV